MEFELTNEQKLIANSAKDFIKKEVYPLIQQNNNVEHINQSVIRKMGDAGFLGLCIPVKYGGIGSDHISLGLTCLEFEKIDTASRFVLTAHHALNSIPLLRWGTENQKRKYLMPQVRGEKIAAFAMAEPNAGADITGIQTLAQPKGDYYILNGEKTWITHAGIADNILVFAKTINNQNNELSAFIVEKNFPGITTSTITGKLGINSGNTGSISFTDVKVPKENLLGGEGKGLQVAFSALDIGLYTVAAGAVGVIETCLELSVKYANERETFGIKIGKHQLIQQMIAKIVAAHDVGRLLIYHVGFLKDRNKDNFRETSLAKWINCNNAFESANNALQIFGAYGYSSEFEIERIFRNSRGSLIYGLPQEIHTLMQAEYALGYRNIKT